MPFFDKPDKIVVSDDGLETWIVCLRYVLQNLVIVYGLFLEPSQFLADVLFAFAPFPDQISFHANLHTFEIAAFFAHLFALIMYFTLSNTFSFSDTFVFDSAIFMHIIFIVTIFEKCFAFEATNPTIMGVVSFGSCWWNLTDVTELSIFQWCHFSLKIQQQVLARPSRYTSVSQLEQKEREEHRTFRES